MAIAVGVLNIVLGLVYLQYGTMTILDMRRSWSTLGFSHFGAAWILMAFTCGPHHVVHGIHNLADGRAGGALDLATIIIGYPAGVGWFLLRVEAYRGGRGDRFISGTPGWLHALPILAGAYVSALVSGVLAQGSFTTRYLWQVSPNLLLVVIYAMIGFYLLRTQLANRPHLGGWSVSGLCLAVIFPTCAVMHGVWALYGLTGRYHTDGQGLPIDWLAVPAGIYFLWVVRSLYRETLADWDTSEIAPARDPAPSRIPVTA